MGTGIQKAAVWCGPIFIVMFFVGLLCAGFIPPSQPSLPASDIAAMYRDHTNMIRAGMTLQIVAAGFQVMFAAVIAVQLLRIGEDVKVLALAELGAGSAGIVLFLYPPIFWAVAAYRPDRAADVTQVLHDLGWMSFIVPFILGFFQCLTTGVAIMADRAARPLFPRWIGYLNIWAALALTPGPLAMFFKGGPFAWNGLIVFWLPASVFGVWYIVMTMALLGAIKRDSA